MGAGDITLIVLSAPRSSSGYQFFSDNLEWKVPTLLAVRYFGNLGISSKIKVS